MIEKTALRCLDCDNSFIVKTPDNQMALRELVQTLKICGDCRGNRIVQVAWICS